MILLLLGFGVVKGVTALARFMRAGQEAESVETAEEAPVEVPISVAAPVEEKPTDPVIEAFFDGYEAASNADTQALVHDAVQSTYAVLINAATGEVVASRGADTVINPASMTKILTLLVAVEELEARVTPEQTLEDLLAQTVVMDEALLNYTYSKDCSQAGFSFDEEVTVQDLLYGTILPSGGDAAMHLAAWASGDEEAFAARMNEKLRELGLADTAHFTNSVGLYAEEHHCTLIDMAMMLKAALENDLCREVLSARTYTTSQTAQHPDGIEISNWFLRRIEDKDSHGEVRSAKTGFVSEAGCCAASFQLADDGTPYFCVTADAWSSWRAIYDHVTIYQLYTGQRAGELGDVRQDMPQEETGAR